MEEEVAKFIPCLILSCLKYTETHYYFENELEKLYVSHMFHSISDSMMHFYIAFEAEYKSIIEKVFEDPSFMKSKSRFLSKIGSRCLKMSDNPTYFSFLLMCAFIGQVLSFCYKNGKCYRVAESACKCAVAIFQRNFREYFYREGGLTGLTTYSDGLNFIVLQLQNMCDDLKDILSADLGSKQIVLRLLHNCIDVDSSQYFLNDFERNILYRATKIRLRKLKPNLDLLIYRIPKKYFETRKNQESQNVSPNASGSNSSDIASDQSAEYSLSGYNPILPSSSVSDSCSSPIDYSMKRDSESLNCNITENQPELPSCHTIEELSEVPSCHTTEELSDRINNCKVENPSEELNCFVPGNESDSLDCYISEKRFGPSSSCVIKERPELSNCCITEMEIEPLNYCIAKKYPEPSSKETRAEGCLLLVHHERIREMHSENFESSNKQLKSSTWSPQKLEGRFSLRYGNVEFSNKGDRIRNPDNRQIGTSPEPDTVLVPKRSKTSKSPDNKLALETENEIKPLNYCIAIKDPGLSITETRPERSLSLVHCETSQETQLENYEPSNKQLMSSTWYPHSLESSFSARSMNLEFSNKGDRIRSPDNRQTGTSQETDAPSIPKIRKTLNSLENKLALETDFRSSQKQIYPHSLNFCERTIHMPPRYSTFKGELRNTNRCLFKMETELPKKNTSEFPIHSGEDYNIQNHPATSSSKRNSHSLETQTKPILSSSTIPSTSKCLMPSGEDNSIQNHPSTSSYNRNYLLSELQTKARFLSSIIPSISNFPIPSGEDYNIQNHPSTSSFYRNSLPSEFPTIFPSSSIIPSTDNSLMPSGEDNTIHNIPSTRFSDSNSLPLELQTEEIFPSTSIDSSQKSLGNIPHSPQDQNLAEVHNDKPSLKTEAAMSLVSYGFDGHKKERNRISIRSLSSDSSSSVSEGYYTSESDISISIEDEEFHYLPPFYCFQGSSSDNSPSEIEYCNFDWEGDTTLTNLMRHQCFHCRTKCFNYVMHVFRQYTSHFIDGDQF